METVEREILSEKWEGRGGKWTRRRRWYHLIWRSWSSSNFFAPETLQMEPRKPSRTMFPSHWTQNAWVYHLATSKWWKRLETGRTLPSLTCANVHTLSYKIFSASNLCKSLFLRQSFNLKVYPFHSHFENHFSLIRRGNRSNEAMIIVFFVLFILFSLPLNS
jgi:hypothetical protein